MTDKKHCKNLGYRVFLAIIENNEKLNTYRDKTRNKTNDVEQRMRA